MGSEVNVLEREILQRELRSKGKASIMKEKAQKEQDERMDKLSKENYYVKPSDQGKKISKGHLKIESTAKQFSEAKPQGISQLKKKIEVNTQSKKTKAISDSKKSKTQVKGEEIQVKLGGDLKEELKKEQKKLDNQPESLKQENPTSVNLNIQNEGETDKATINLCSFESEKPEHQSEVKICKSVQREGQPDLEMGKRHAPNDQICAPQDKVSKSKRKQSKGKSQVKSTSAKKTGGKKVKLND